jgi:hypothetical protein
VINVDGGRDLFSVQPPQHDGQDIGAISFGVVSNRANQRAAGFTNLIAHARVGAEAVPNDCGSGFSPRLSDGPEGSQSAGIIDRRNEEMFTRAPVFQNLQSRLVGSLLGSFRVTMKNALVFKMRQDVADSS